MYERRETRTRSIMSFSNDQRCAHTTARASEMLIDLQLDPDPDQPTIAVTPRCYTDAACHPSLPRLIPPARVSPSSFSIFLKRNSINSLFINQIAKIASLLSKKRRAPRPRQVALRTLLSCLLVDLLWTGLASSSLRWWGARYVSYIALSQR